MAACGRGGSSGSDLKIERKVPVSPSSPLAPVSRPAVSPVAHSWYRRSGKRLFDVVVGTAMFLVLLPLMTVTAALVACFLGRPVFFRQARPGKDGKPFEMVKFRTMTDARDANGTLLPDDQRLTRLGRWLRASSLDELPELINVLRGEMSLVGPRPLLLRYLDRYTPEQFRRHEVPPGITGWAQVKGRNAISWDQKFAYDLWYVDHYGFWVDIGILIRTALRLVMPTGISAAGHATMPEFLGNDDNPMAKD